MERRAAAPDEGLETMSAPGLAKEVICASACVLPSVIYLRSYSSQGFPPKEALIKRDNFASGLLATSSSPALRAGLPTGVWLLPSRALFSPCLIRKGGEGIRLASGFSEVGVSRIPTWNFEN